MRLLRRNRVKIPVRLQASAVECGAACLAMVLGAFGRHVRISELRERMGIGRDGASVRGIVDEARAQGLEATGFRATPDQLPSLEGPLIAHWEMSHFVIIERATEHGASIVDPASGRRWVDADELDRSLTGVVVALRPETTLQRTPGHRLELVKFIRPYLPKARVVVGVVLGASTVLTLLGLLPALLTGYVVDRVLPAQQFSVLPVLLLGILAYTLAHALTSLGRTELLLWLRTKINWSMMTNFLKHMVSLPYKYFQIRHGGDLLQRVTSTAYIRELVGTQLLAAVVDVALLLIYLAIIGAKFWIFAVAILVVASVQVIAILTTARKAQRLSEREMHAMGDAQSALLETVTSIETVKAAGVEDSAVSRWAGRFTGEIDASVKRERLDNRIEFVLGFFQTLSPVALTWIGAVAVMQGDLTLGEMLALTALTASALEPITKLGQNIKALQTVRVHLDRLRDVLLEDPESTRQGDVRMDLTGAIELDDVTFRYEGKGPAAIRGVQLDVAAGQKIAIVGRSGSGKSTLARLMIGLHVPASGKIAFDGVPVDELDLTYLRRQCGVVTQDTQHMSGSILSAITLTAPVASLTEVVQAAQLAGIHDDIMAMPMQYETVLGEGGMGLSGGQLQRLALARALVNQPRVLLLDEATSALDATTERLVQQSIADLKCTRLVVAHRLSTIRDADLILLMDDGRIVERGTHDELLASDGAYADLVTHQLA